MTHMCLQEMRDNLCSFRLCKAICIWNNLRRFLNACTTTLKIKYMFGVTIALRITLNCRFAGGLNGTIQLSNTLNLFAKMLLIKIKRINKLWLVRKAKGISLRNLRGDWTQANLGVLTSIKGNTGFKAVSGKPRGQWFLTWGKFSPGGKFHLPRG